MPSFDFIVESNISRTSRVKQLEAMFDVPANEKSKIHFSGLIDIEENDWNIGIIVGASGSGKTSIAKNIFGDFEYIKWSNNCSVIDEFNENLSIEDISKVCSSVGFNTIPAWMRPYSVLSNGEKFRVEIARLLLSDKTPLVVDEFTSVVDRNVAKIVSNSTQKYVRKNKLKFVAISCHYDIIDWLQPDWIFDCNTMKFERRLLRQRPEINIEIAKVEYSAWHMFSKFHYLTSELHRGAQCFALMVDGQMASFAGMLHRPHPKVKDIIGCSRLVTLPDYQGLGLAMILIDFVAACYKSINKRVHTYPAHPSLIRSFNHSNNWSLKKKPGIFSSVSGNRKNANGKNANGKVPVCSSMGGRPCAVFEYVGEPNKDKAFSNNFIKQKIT